MKNFGYQTILCSFFFEKVVGLCPKVSVSVNNPRDPRMGIWVDLMKFLGGGDVPRMTFDDDFFTRWDQQIIIVNDYLYESMDL